VGTRRTLAANSLTPVALNANRHSVCKVDRVTSNAWTRWAATRPTQRVLHLDSAACGRASTGVLDAVASHARLEAEVGGYVAQEAVGDVLDGLRRDVAGLLGMDTEAVALVESGSAARDALLEAWPLPENASIAVVASEWGPNLEAFAFRGLEPVFLPVDENGVLALDGLEQLLRTNPPTVVHLTQLAAHRGLTQPVAAAGALCRAHGVPMWVDAAQAIGHLDTAVGADAIYATSRKWINGPRGVGMLAIATEHHSGLRVRWHANSPDLPLFLHLESHEAHIAGRVGLATAVREHLDLDPVAVRARLTEVGRLSRDLLADVDGWSLANGTSEGAITALKPTWGQDVLVTRSRLLAEHAILATASLPWRAPHDLSEPLLRISPHVDADEESMGHVCAALADLTKG
jgi:pyridoxal 5-phosphate dependent beta-lyase